MKLLHEEIKTDIVFREGTVNVWVIESKAVLNRLVRELIDQGNGNEGGFVLSDGNEILRVKDAVNVVTDYFCIPINGKRIKGKIAKLLEEYAEDEMFSETVELKNRLQQYLEFLIEKADIHIEYDKDIDMGSFLKLFDIRVEENFESLLENLCGYLKLMVRLFKNQVFVFVNLKQYLEGQEIEEFYKFIEYEKIWVLLIENEMAERRENEKYLILDRDFCII